jgi:hypothetical protein
MILSIVIIKSILAEDYATPSACAEKHLSTCTQDRVLQKKLIAKNKKMKTIINLNTFIQWPPLTIIFMKVNLIKLRLTSNKRSKKLKYAFHHNTRKYR